MLIPQQFTVDYAPTNRACCKRCGSLLKLGAVRFCRKVRSPWHDGFDTQFNHLRCGTKWCTDLKEIHYLGILGKDQLVQAADIYSADVDFTNPSVMAYLQILEDVRKIRDVITEGKTTLPVLVEIMVANGFPDSALSKTKHPFAIHYIADALLRGRPPPCPICQQNALYPAGYAYYCHGWVDNTTKCDFFYCWAPVGKPESPYERTLPGEALRKLLHRPDPLMIPEGSRGHRVWKDVAVVLSTLARLRGGYQNSISFGIVKIKREKVSGPPLKLIPRSQLLNGLAVGFLGPGRDDYQTLIERHGGLFVPNVDAPPPLKNRRMIVLAKAEHWIKTQRSQKAETLIAQNITPILSTEWLDHLLMNERPSGGVLPTSMLAVTTQADANDFDHVPSTAVGESNKPKQRSSKNEPPDSGAGETQRPGGAELRLERNMNHYRLDGGYGFDVGWIGEEVDKKVLRCPRIALGSKMLTIDEWFIEDVVTKTVKGDTFRIFVDPLNHCFNVLVTFTEIATGRNSFYVIQLIERFNVAKPKKKRSLSNSQRDTTRETKASRCEKQITSSRNSKDHALKSKSPRDESPGRDSVRSDKKGNSGSHRERKASRNSEEDYERGSRIGRRRESLSNQEDKSECENQPKRQKCRAEQLDADNGPIVREAPIEDSETKRATARKASSKTLEIKKTKRTEQEKITKNEERERASGDDARGHSDDSSDDEPKWIDHSKYSVDEFEALQLKKGARYYVFRKWGRLGSDDKRVNDSLTEDYGTNLQDAIEVFVSKYYGLTGVDFYERLERSGIPGRYQSVELKGYETNENLRNKAVDGGKDGQDNTDSKIALNTQNGQDSTNVRIPSNIRTLIEKIFSIDVIKDTLNDMMIDPQTFDLQSLSTAQLNSGFQILSELEQFIEQKAIAKAQSDQLAQARIDAKLKALTGKFYALVPRSFAIKKIPPPIASKALLTAQIRILEDLIAISESAAVINPIRSDTDPLPQFLNAMIYRPERVGPRTPVYRLISEMVEKGHAPTHSAFSMEVANVYALRAKANAEDQDQDFVNMPNKRLLWHGSRLSNWAGIMTQGLQVAPPQAPKTGYMFDKGIYFADVCSKSAEYCKPTSDNPTGFLFLCEVALGRPYVCLEADENALKTVEGKAFDSTIGLGKTGPDLAQFKSIATLVGVDNFDCCDVKKGESYVSRSVLPFVEDAKRVGVNTGPLSSQKDLCDEIAGEFEARYGRKPLRALLYNEYVLYRTKQIQPRYLVELRFNFKSFVEMAAESSDSSEE